MAVLEGRTWLEMLSPVACDRHLRTQTVGRIALDVDGHPENFPVNYAVDERGDFYFRTAHGTKLQALSRPKPMALEIDSLDDGLHEGWSVVVVGTAVHIGLPHEIVQAHSLPLEPWAQGEKPEVIRLRPSKVTGRRIHRPRMNSRAGGVR
jgi:nitroimidazol reductase NimA-like FMN-containing flavoprotein (pyridoxamine 5'-phosphate oxidase superfamily)